jgi:hypothetical protein
LNLQVLIRPTRGLIALFISLVAAASPASAQNWIRHRVTTNLTYLTCIASAADGTKLLIGSGLSSSGSGQSGPRRPLSLGRRGGNLAGCIDAGSFK